MDRIRIEEEFDKKYPIHFLSWNAKDLAFEFCEHIAKLAREEALDQAAKACEQVGVSVNNEWNRGLGIGDNLQELANDCTEAIRALKEQE